MHLDKDEKRCRPRFVVKAERKKTKKKMKKTEKSTEQVDTVGRTTL